MPRQRPGCSLPAREHADCLIHRLCEKDLVSHIAFQNECVKALASVFFEVADYRGTDHVIGEFLQYLAGETRVKPEKVGIDVSLVRDDSAYSPTGDASDDVQGVLHVPQNDLRGSNLRYSKPVILVNYDVQTWLPPEAPGYPRSAGPFSTSSISSRRKSRRARRFLSSRRCMMADKFCFICLR
jgi:hypothetical protein